MLKHDDTRFLDDLTVEDVSRQLDIAIFPVSGVEELIERCLDNTNLDNTNLDRA